MGDRDNLFSDFPEVSGRQWRAQVERDLKGKPLSDLQWQLEEQIVLEPFYHPDDMDGALPDLTAGRTGNDWKVGEYIDVRDVPKAHAQLLEELKGGIEAPLFRLYRPLKDGELGALLEGVDFSSLSLHFGQFFAGKAPRKFFEQWVSLLKETGKDLATVEGTLDFDPILDWSEPPFEDLAEALKFSAAEMPHFGVVQVNARRFHSGIENTTRELAYTIAAGSEYLAQMDERGITPQVTDGHMQFAVAVSTSYFVEIAKLRALRILWANVQKAYGIKNGPFPSVEVHLAPETQDENIHTNMIRATTQAMSAIIGGADRLYVLPADATIKEENAAFTRRIARNLQHILKKESYFDRVADPAAGSYYVEKLTRRLAEESWAKFQEIEAGGGFMNTI
jgi:methylmalonyl-CoA mutase